MPPSKTPLLDRLAGPKDLRSMNDAELQQLNDELRYETIQAVSQTGGHLGASLGVVELTVALHAVFDTPSDVLIWDVGHQAYPHKILTGRRHAMHSLRQMDGLSGFTKRVESDFDPFGAGHAGTSISAAVGFAAARDQRRERSHVIAVIGDGAMSAGMAFEALNHAGDLGQNLIVILNDNAMSIDPAVGALTDHFAKLRAGNQGTLFEPLGFSYRGPIDGHDLAGLLRELRSLQSRPSGPVLLHCVTEKGKGFAAAEASEDRYHGVGKFDPDNGALAPSANGPPSYSHVFGQTLSRLAETDPGIIAVTAAMASGTGLDIMQRSFPDRVYDVGIAEQHAVTFSAGAAAGGLKPFCALYSCFLQRGYDQVVHDVAVQDLAVRFCIDRAGLVGADGATHAGAFDIGFLANLPNFTVMAAADEAELVRMLATMAAHDDGPSAVRYPRGAGTGVDLPEPATPIPIGKGRILQQGDALAFLSFGAHLDVVRGAANALENAGIRATIADARFAKPLDTALIERLAKEHKVLLTVEQGAALGFGALVLAHLAEHDILKDGPVFRSLHLPDHFIDQGSPAEMYAKAGLSQADLVEAASAALEKAG